MKAGSGNDLHVERVRDYYEDNIHRFLKFGQSGAVDAVRRAVWGPAAKTRDQALNYVNELIFAELNADFPPGPEDADPVRVLDMGCGVGGGLIYLAQRRLMRGLGINIGGVQIALAREKAEKKELFPGSRCEFLQGSYLEPPAEQSFHLVFCVEAFVCGPDGEAFFRAAAKALKPGGILIVCDDFLSAEDESAGAKGARILEEFRQGWYAKTLITTREAERLAREAGLRARGRGNLTPYLELGRPRDRLIALLVALGRPLRLKSPAWKNMLGGNALQTGLRRGLLEYRFLIFKKPD